MTATFQRRPGCSAGIPPRRSSITSTKSSLAMRLVHDGDGLGRWRLGGRYAGKSDAKARAPTQPRLEAQAAAQLLRYEIVDDVETKPGSALVSPGRKEGIERAALGLLGHSDAVIGDEELHVIADLTGLDQDAAGATVGKGVDHAVEKQVGQYLSVGARITVHDDARGDIDGKRNLGFFQDRAQARNNVIRRFAQIELPAIGMAAIDCNLLERLHQLAGALKIADQLVGRVPAGNKELVEPRAAHRARIHLAGKIIAAARKA